ncbi:MAG: phosphate signaling complex protein PhoU [Culicoidibacterales bacterium]
MGRIIDEHLNVVVEKIGKLFDMTMDAYHEALVAFETDNRKKALKITKNDAKINELEEEINEDTIRVITLQAPVASDLRLLIASLKIAGQLERIADYTVNIADHVLIGEEEEESATAVDKNISEMISYVIEMLVVAKRAYNEQNIYLAKDVIDMDNKLDHIYGKSISKLAKTVGDLPEDGDEVPEVNLNSVLMVKYMERAGDHVTNIAEHVFYMVKGRNYDIHHVATLFDNGE